MSQHHDDFENFLRGALHTAVDPVEPADDGLERIRARLTPPRPLPVAWLMAACSWVARRAWGSLESVSAWLRTVPGEVHKRDGKTAPDERQMQRLRLVATVATVAVLMAIALYAVSPMGRQVISQAGTVLHSIGGEPAGTGEPAASGPGSGAAGGAGTTPGGQDHGQPAASCPSGASDLAVPPAGPATPGSPASTSPASTPPASPPAASTIPASPPAASTTPASPPATSTTPASPPAAGVAPVP